jgi:hypothetical protein
LLESPKDPTANTEMKAGQTISKVWTRIRNDEVDCFRLRKSIRIKMLLPM